MIEQQRVDEYSEIIRKSGIHIPEHMHDGISRYVVYGICPGSFLTAVLCNNFVEAFSRADHHNSQNMRNYANLLYSILPSNSWGSEKNFKNWMESGGLSVLEKNILRAKKPEMIDKPFE